MAGAGEPNDGLDLSGVTIQPPLCAVFRKHLRELGQKYTPERARILSTLVEMDDLFQVEDLMTRLRDDGFRVSKATVYRTVHLLQEAGIIQQVLVDTEHAHYQLAFGRKPRDLVVNVDTNEIRVIELPELDALLERACAERGLEVEGRRVVVYARGGRS
jgi:Fur family ferric uptake transcriptional regulator